MYLVYLRAGHMTEIFINKLALKTNRFQWFESLAHLNFNLVESFPLTIMEPRRPLFQEILYYILLKSDDIGLYLILHRKSLLKI